MNTPAGPRILCSAHPLRALAETALATGLALLGMLQLRGDLHAQHIRQGLWFLMPLGVLLYAARLRLPTGSRRHKLGCEALAAASVAALFILLLLLLSVLLGPKLRAEGRPFPQMHDWLIMLFSGAGTAALRVGVRLWLLWDGLRRRHLVWSLTHAHMTLVAAVLLPLVLFVAVIVANEGYVNTVLTEQDTWTGSLAKHLIVGLLPALVAYSIVAAVVLAALLPPLALVSFLVARRTARRVNALAQAAGALSAGNYAARVQVSGQDEVARLQADFNAMAAEMERTLGELAAERDTVAGLLEARRALFATVSHELRTPVATLRGYLESALARGDAASAASLRHDLEIMERELHRLQSLIEDLFTLARADAHRLDLHLCPTDAGQVIHQLVESVAPLAWQSGRVQVTADVAPGLPPVLADADRLAQVLGNLLHNAGRHTPPGGIVAISAARENGCVRIDVRDTGAGIPLAELPHVWDRFYRGGDARKMDSAGSGLGLALVKELTEAMGGSVAVESIPHTGSCFSIRLPAA